MTDDPRELATLIASLPKPLLLGTDVDGTLAEITEDPSASRLLEGALAALDALRERGVEIAVVSGRPMCDLVAQFGFPSAARLIGSHGAERGADPEAATVGGPTVAESALLDTVKESLTRVAAEHEGAWVESKPFGAAIHVRRCADVIGDRALLAARSALADLDGVRTFDGHMVLEATVRETSKRAVMQELRTELRPATTVFVGDDASDEGVFESLAGSDVAVKVGPGVTLATHRIAGPQDTVELLTHLATLV